jgi:pimeloyl-ACP methyl ester carboxylesterase
VAVDLPRDGGRLVQRVGRADAEVVVVLVPGVGTDRTDRARLVADAERVWRAAVDHVDDAAAVAVVSWLGYDPPDRVVQAVDAAPADEGAGLLARELRRLRRRGARRVAVVGHSYGGVVAGRAAGPGGADVVVQLGAPGVGEPGGVDVLAAAGVRLVAVRAVGDPIGVVAGRAPGLYGEDPVGAVPGLPTSRSGHSAYLRDPVLLDALGGLVVGSSAPPTRPLGSPSVG